MSFYLKWAKSNLVVVILFVVALVALPVGYIFSSGMSTTIREQVDEQVNKATGELRRINTTYDLPSFAIGGEEWSYTGAPNGALNDVYKARRSAIVEQIGGLKGWMESFNQRDLTPLIPELFPYPEGGESGTNNRVELSRRMVEEFPGALQEILKRAGVQSPPVPQEVLAQIQRTRQIEVNRRLSDRVEQVLTDDELVEIEQTLIESRLAIYSARASEASFYGDSSIFDLARAADIYSNSIPNRSQFQRIFWQWQHTMWVYDRVLQALAQVNGGVGQSLVTGPLKRVLSISVEPFPEEQTVSNPGDYGTTIQSDITTSFTGRVPANSIYDLRSVTVDLIVSAGGVNQLIDRIQSGNFIAVTDIDYSAYEAEGDLAQGYLYGSESLVRCTLTLQTVWIRSWYQEIVPPDVRAGMGLPPIEGLEQEQSDAAAGNDRSSGGGRDDRGDRRD